MRLPEAEARRRLSEAPVARLATASADGRPHIVPVTFVLDDELIYTAIDAKPKTTRDLRRLENLRANPRAAVLADHYDDDWTALWWVRADGVATIVDDQAGMAGPVAALARRYQQYQADPPAGPVIEIRIERLTGWSAT